MARIFLSMASGEFRPYRQLLSQQLGIVGQVPVDQEHFPNMGVKLLRLLDEKIKSCDHVIHVVGTMTGEKLSKNTPHAPQAQLQEFIDGCPDNFLQKSGLAAHANGLDCLSYTQFEYWAARYHGLTPWVYVLAPPPGAPAEVKLNFDPEQTDHLARIKQNFIQRDSVHSDWNLVGQVLVGLCAAGTIVVAEAEKEPVIVLGLRTAPEIPEATGSGNTKARFYHLSGAARWLGQVVGDMGEAVVNVDDPADLGDRCASHITRGHEFLAAHPLGARKTVIELVLPEELLARPLSEWMYRKRGVLVPIRDSYPVRVRLAGRGVDELSRIRSRLELLRDHQGKLTGVCRELPEKAHTDPGYPPVALVHDGACAAPWHRMAVVCGGFLAPPRARRAAAGTRRRSTRRPEVLRAVDDGVPYLLWPDKSAAPEALELHLKDGHPSRLCLNLEREQFVVFAEGMNPAFPEGPSLYSDTK